MFAKLPSAALRGVEAYRVDVEVDVSGGIPSYHVVGLPAASVKEGATRIRSALRNCGHDLPTMKVTVNLAPADRRKDGAAFDLPIAVGVVAAGGALGAGALDGLLLMGELGLDGSLRPVRGVLAAASLARRLGLRGLLVPRGCAAEALAVGEVAVYAADHLGDVLRAMDGTGQLVRVTAAPARPASSAPPAGDFADVRGQELARRAVEVAVAGGHNVLLFGQPGIGKTMIARRIPSILPPLARDEQIEVTAIYSAAGMSPAGGLVERRPFRAPHHTISTAALIGGGPIPRPGEISLAHHGVLFLDELPELPRHAIEALRQPLEDRCVSIGRVSGSVRLPASFLLVASANPCPCGWHGSEERACTCSLGALERYRSRLSGPILDRIDIQVRVGNVGLQAMRAAAPAEGSAAIRARVEEARSRQAHRLAAHRVRLNAELGPETTRSTCKLTLDAERALARIHATRGLTARGLDRLLRTARTIADLDGVDPIGPDALHEAAVFRALDLDPLVDPRRVRPAQMALRG